MTGVIEGSVVTGNPAIIIGAVIIALGLQVANEAGVFENLANSAVNALETSGGWIKDGAMELIKTVDETGRATYYAAGELFETVRSWLFDSGVVSVVETPRYTGAGFEAAMAEAITWPYWLISDKADGYPTIFVSETPLTTGYYAAYNDNCIFVGDKEAYTLHVTETGFSKIYRKPGSIWRCADVYTSPIMTSVSSSYNLELGNVPMSYIDGTSALAWAPEYANRQLRVIEGGGGGNSGGDQSGDTGDQKWKWYLPISLAATLAGVAVSNQQIQHSGVTPSDFDDTTPVRDLDIIGTPNIDGLPGLEINPSTNPNPGTNPDPGTNPNPGTNPGTGVPSDIGKYQIDLKDFFPFCIPFDLYRFIEILCAEPEAPVFHWEFNVFGELHSLDVDLSPWNPHAQLFRDAQVGLFIMGLLWITRKFIKW